MKDTNTPKDQTSAPSKSLGQIHFEAFCRAFGATDDWDNHSDEWKAAQETAAQAVVKVMRELDGPRHSIPCPRCDTRWTFRMGKGEWWCANCQRSFQFGKDLAPSAE